MKRTAIVTGATGRIGKAIARGLAASGDYRVIVVGRNRDKCQNTVDELIGDTGNSDLSYELCDLSRKIQIQALHAALLDSHGETFSIDILVNNAAICPRRREITPEGLEMQWATNVLGYYWLTSTLQPFFKPGSRVVLVASYYAGGLDLKDPMFEKRPYSNDAAYRAAKQANRMLAAGLAARLGPGVCINAAHSGDVESALSNALGFGGWESPEQGAETPLWLATAPQLQETSGQYFEHKKSVHCPYAADREMTEKLLKLCAAY